MANSKVPHGVSKGDEASFHRWAQVREHIPWMLPPRGFTNRSAPRKASSSHPISRILSASITHRKLSNQPSPQIMSHPSKYMSMFIPDLFQGEYETRQCWRNISTYAQDLRHPFQMLHRRLRVLLRSWARNGLRKCKIDGSIIQIYQSTPLHYWGHCITRNLGRT